MSHALLDHTLMPPAYALAYSMDDVRALKTMDDPETSLPFIKEILSSVRSTIDDETALIGFIGTPWTLAAYAMEGKAEKNCRVTKVRHHALLSTLPFPPSYLPFYSLQGSWFAMHVQRHTLFP